MTHCDKGRNVMVGGASRASAIAPVKTENDQIFIYKTRLPSGEFFRHGGSPLFLQF